MIAVYNAMKNGSGSGIAACSHHSLSLLFSIRCNSRCVKTLSVDIAGDVNLNVMLQHVPKPHRACLFFALQTEPGDEERGRNIAQPRGKATRLAAGERQVETAEAGRLRTGVVVSTPCRGRVHPRHDVMKARRGQGLYLMLYQFRQALGGVAVASLFRIAE